MRKIFPPAVLQRIADAVRASERKHSGELRFAVEGGLDLPDLVRGVSARARAVELFSRLRVWDTEQNSGVLIYIQLADRHIEILADRGIAARVAQAEWDSICRECEAAFRREDYEHGLLNAVSRISILLVRHFPAAASNPDELPDQPVIL